MRNRLSTSITLLLLGCGTAGEEERVPGNDPLAGPVASSSAASAVLEREIGRIDAEAGRIDSIFQPLPLLRPAQENALRRYDNAQQLARARALGVGRLLPPDRLTELRNEGALVLLEDTEHWVVRDMDHSQPLAVPAVHALLTRIGERFHARLAALGAPAFRMEVTSALRSAADQAELRRINPNAAEGRAPTSTERRWTCSTAPSRRRRARSSSWMWEKTTRWSRI